MKNTTKTKKRKFMVHVNYVETCSGTKLIYAKDEKEAKEIAENTDFSEFDCDTGDPDETLEVRDITEII